MSRVKPILLAAIFVATAFTFSCSGDDGGNDDSSSGGSVVLPSSSSSVSAGGACGGVITGSSTMICGGQVYKTVVIGSQTWMAENLNFDVSGSACYDNISSNCVTYGRLYNWNAAMSACPPGWRLPTDAEWTALTNHVGSNAGTKLKASSGWSSNTGTDDFGFSALPGGFGWDGSFGYVGNFGYWWSATENTASNAWSRYMTSNFSTVSRRYSNKSDLFSVRCVLSGL